MSSFPAPPWTLYGWAGLLVDWIDFSQVPEKLLPPGFQYAPFYRSDTLSGHYFGSYTPTWDSSFKQPFHEFGFITALAQSGGAQGFHLAGMGVDHPGALEGGQRFWGLQKSIAEFTRTGEYGLAVKMTGRVYAVTVEFKKWISLGFWKVPFSFLVRQGHQVLQFTVTYHGEAFYCRAKTQGLTAKGWRFPILFDRCWITIEAPVVVTADK